MKKALLILMTIMVIFASTLTVNAEDKSVKIFYVDYSQKTIKSGEKFSMSCHYAPTSAYQPVVWTSSNSEVAYVDGGNIKGLKAGTAIITARMGNASATCRVTVTYVKPHFVNGASILSNANKYRKACGLKTLKKNKKLEKYAKIRAKEIHKKFSHTRPNKKKGTSIIPGNIWKGENLGKHMKNGCSISMCGKEIVQDWINSPGHRANMIRKQFKKHGAAGYFVDGRIYWVHLFSS